MLPTTDKKNDDKEDQPDITLDDFGDDEDDGLDDQQLTLKQVAEESHQDDEEIDYFCIITSKSVDHAGIDPDENPIGHYPEGSAWGIGRLYHLHQVGQYRFRFCPVLSTTDSYSDQRETDTLFK